MMIVPLETVDEQRKQLHQLADAVESITKEVVSGSDGSKDLYKELLQRLGPLLEAQQLDAASFAAQFYDWVRGESIGGSFDAIPYTGINNDAFAHELQYITEHYDDPDKIANQIILRADRHMMQAYVNTMFDAAGKDSAEVRFARVTRGDSHVCKFCDMLSSRGWVYYTAKTATNIYGSIKLYHAHCRCIAVPGFGTYEVGFGRRLAMHTKVEGYDPQAAFERYLAAGGPAAFQVSPEARVRHKKRKQEKRLQELLTVSGSDEFLSGAKDIENLQWRYEYLVGNWRSYKPDEFKAESLEDVLRAIATSAYRKLLKGQEASITYK